MADILHYRHMAGEYLLVTTDAPDPSASKWQLVWRLEWVDAEGRFYIIDSGLTYQQASLEAFDLSDKRECGLVFKVAA